MVFFHNEEWNFYKIHSNARDLLRDIFPLSIAMLCAKCLTYSSYGRIPVSLTHTVKALQPFFNVIIVFLWTHELVDGRTFLTLIPIVFGVAYASSKELE